MEEKDRAGITGLHTGEPQTFVRLDPVKPDCVSDPHNRYVSGIGSSPPPRLWWRLVLIIGATAGVTGICAGGRALMDYYLPLR